MWRLRVDSDHVKPGVDTTTAHAILLKYADADAVAKVLYIFQRQRQSRKAKRENVCISMIISIGSDDIFGGQVWYILDLGSWVR